HRNFGPPEQLTRFQSALAGDQPAVGLDDDRVQQSQRADAVGEPGKVAMVLSVSRANNDFVDATRMDGGRHEAFRFAHESIAETREIAPRAVMPARFRFDLGWCWPGAGPWPFPVPRCRVCA